MVELRRDVPSGLRPLPDSWIFSKGIPVLEQLTEGKVHSGLDGRFSVIDPVPFITYFGRLFVFYVIGEGIDFEGKKYYVAFTSGWGNEIRFLLEDEAEEGLESGELTIEEYVVLREDVMQADYYKYLDKKKVEP